jgi:hypothetical protein
MRRDEQACVRLTVTIPVGAYPHQDQAERQSQQRAGDQSGLPVQPQRDRRNQQSGQDAADWHATLLDRENEIHMRAAAGARQKMRGRRIGAAIAQSDHQRAKRKARQCADAGQQAAQRSQPKCQLACPCGAQPFDEAAADQGRDHCAEIDDAHLIAHQRRADAKIGRGLWRDGRKHQCAKRGQGLRRQRRRQNLPDRQQGRLLAGGGVTHGRAAFIVEPGRPAAWRDTSSSRRASLPAPALQTHFAEWPANRRAG